MSSVAVRRFITMEFEFFHNSTGHDCEISVSRYPHVCMFLFPLLASKLVKRLKKVCCQMCIRSECWQYTRNIISGWWFGTFFIFPSVGNFIIPTDEVIFFRGVGIPPTSIPRSLSWIYGRSCELFPIGQFTMAGKANENMFIC